MARIIAVTGEVIHVDNCDMWFLSPYVWRIKIDRRNGLPYAYRMLYDKGRNRRWFMHRCILGLRPGDADEVDHVDVRDTLDNRRSNLRLATRSENNANRRLFKNNTTGYRGVSLERGLYVANIRFHGKLYRLGRFTDPLDAHKVYCEKKVELFGRFARVEC